MEFIKYPIETVKKIEQILKFAHENEWDEEDLYLIAKVILAHFRN